MNILEYCRETKADRILFAQSFGDIKDWAEEKLVLTANMQRKFSYTSDHTIYVMSKNFAVDMIENYIYYYNNRRYQRQLGVGTFSAKVFRNHFF